MRYLLVIPNCGICEAKARPLREQLREQGVEFVEVNANTLFRVDGGALDEKVKLELVTELAFHDQNVPLVVEVKEEK